MLDVTVVLLDDGLSSTAIVPIEIFHSAGALWNDLQGRPAAPAFRVTTASLDGGPVRSPYGLDIQPMAAIADIDRTDIVIIPTSGLELDAKLVENSVLLPWLRDRYAQGAYLAGVCMGAAYLAEAGLLDGKLATTHWAAAGDIVDRYPAVNWRPDLLITEDSRLLCSGGVYAAIDVSLYLVEKLCGHEVAVQTSKALLLPMPRTQQSGYAMLPLSPPTGTSASAPSRPICWRPIVRMSPPTSWPRGPASAPAPLPAASRPPPARPRPPMSRRCGCRPPRPC